MSAPEAPAHNPLAKSLEHYWEQSRRPLASLIFVTPLLIAYETGVLVFGAQRVRNGADVWLRQLLDLLGLNQYFLLPVLTICILLAWHYLTRQSWRISGGLIWGMLAECIALSICLRLLLQLLFFAFPARTGEVVGPGGLIGAGNLLEAIGSVGGGVTASIGGKTAEVIGYLGAGIYEELLFRLILLSLTAWVLRRLGLKPGAALAAAVVATSLVFAAAHYLPAGDRFTLFTFVFRFLAGAFFSLLFWYRGFGIAAGAHAGYNILVGLFPRM